MGDQAKLVLVLLFCLVISGCAVRSEKAFIKACDRWIGEDADNLIRQLGPPEQETRLNNGNKILVWDFSYTSQRTYTVPQRHTSYGTVGYYTPYKSTTTTYQTHSYNVHKSCVVMFEVNGQNKIVSYRYRGNDCKVNEE